MTRQYRTDGPTGRARMDDPTPTSNDSGDRETQARARMDANRLNAYKHVDGINSAALKPPATIVGDDAKADPNRDPDDAPVGDDREAQAQRRADARRRDAWRTLRGETGDDERGAA